MRRRGSSVAVNGRALALARVAEIPVHGGSGHAEQVGDLLDRAVFVFVFVFFVV